MGKYKYYYLHPVKATLAKRKRLLHHVAILGSPLLFLLAVTVGGIMSPHSYAASYTWDGGGATNNWSDCANWSTNVCPVAADTVTFNATSVKDSTIDAAWGGSLTGLTIASGYTGTITMARSLTLSGAFSQADGTFTATNQLLDLNNSFVLSGGSFTASSGDTQVSLNFTISGGTFTANGGTLILDGGGTSISCNSAVFNLVRSTYTGTNTRAINSNCSLPLGADPVVSARFNVSGELTGSGVLTFAGAANSIQSTGVFTGFTGFVGALAVQGGTLDFGSYTLADFVTFSVASGATFTAPQSNMSVSNTFTINAAGTFNANGGTLIFDGGSATLTCGSATFNLVVFSGGVSKGVSSDCTMPLGNDPVITGTISLSGVLSGTGRLTAAIFTMQSGSSLSGFDALTTNNTFTVNGTANFGLFTNLDINSTFVLNNGAVFTAPTAVANFAGTFTLNVGSTFNANGGTVVFDGAGSAVITCNGATFNLVQISHTSNTKTISDGCVLPLGNDPTVSATVIINGVLAGTGMLTRSIGTTTINATGNITGFSALNAVALVVNGAAIDWEDYDSITTAAFTATSATLNWSGVGSLLANGTVTLNDTTLSAPVATDINGGLIMNTGTVFTAPSGTMYLGGGLTVNSGTTFNHNGGTLELDGSAGTFSCNNTVFNLIVVRKTGVANGTINADCIFPLGHNPTAQFASTSNGWAINGQLTGSGVLTLTGTAVNFNAPGAMVGFSGVVGYIVTYNGGTVDFSNFSIAQIRVFTLRGGVSFTAPSGDLRTGSFRIIDSGANFNANGGTLVIFGNDASSATFDLACDNAVLNLVRFDAINRTSVASDCTLPLGANPTIAGPAIREKPIGRQPIQLSGRLTGSGTLTLYGVLGLNAGYQLDGFSDIIADNVTVSNATADLSSLDSLSVLWDLAITGSMTPPGLMSVGGNISKTTGSTFDPAGGTTLLTGTDQTLTGDIEFHNLTKTTSGIVTVGAGNTITTTGLFKLSGPSLVSSAPGSVWNVNMQGSTNICGVSVTDSNSIGNAVVAYQSNSYSTNPGWVFLNSACPGSGGGGGGGTGGEPISTVTNYTNAQAAATAAGITTANPNTTLPPYYGLPSTLAKTVDTIPGSREALRAFLRFVGITGLIMALTGGVIWFVASKRHKDEDDVNNQFPASWNNTRVR